ncbi:MAG: hypothetical protein K0B52_05295 [FCB group bacterium]|nr:hypothetical protein [FCB group bacterium]
MLRYIFVMIFVSCLYACVVPEANSHESGIYHDPEFILELRENATDTLRVDGTKYVLEAYLWRDFMPVCPPDGQPLIAANYLVNLDSVAVPDRFDLILQYVIKDDSVWIAEYSGTVYYPAEYKIARNSTNGPMWGPLITVDVIARLRDSETQTDHLLKCDSVMIVRTD